VAGPNPAGVPEHAFLTNPTRCTPAGAGLETRVRAVSWDPTSAPVEGSFVSHLPPGYPLAPEDWGAPQGPTGCDDVPFEPSIEVRADTRRPDSPTGLDIDIAFPQDGLVNPLGIATAHLDRAQVTLPDGMTISPASADGLAACSDDQFGIDSRDPVSCPAASKIGTVEAETPLLEERLTGGLYVGEQRSQDPESGEMFRLFMTLESPQRGIRVKLAGRVRADAETGRLETVFDDNPQLPVTKISLRIKGGPRAPLATPPTCGVKTVTSELTAWSGASATPSDSFTVDCPGQQGFSPSFEAGSTVAVGGAFSPFLARIGRPDGQQFLSGVQVDTPKGLVAKLRGVPLCGSVAAANGGCPEGSRIGTATVGAGAGSNPFYLSGPVYLTTGYKGAPYGLSTQVPVKAGPFDLGTVVVRQAIHIDPETAELSVVSDPLPQIVGGVPARLRSVEVDVDRAGFTVNPTSCAEKRIDATLTSIGGAVHRTSSRFQVGDCQSLGFEPRLAMRLVGRKQRRTGGHPSLRVSLRQPSGQANLNRLRVALPRTLALDPGNANGLCSYEEGLKHDPKCPASSIVGRATAFTPVLNEPLTGPVYFVENKRRTAQGNLVRTLPTLVIPLRGEVAINVRQRSSVSGGRLVSTTTGIPDAPVSRFDLRLNGGRGGILTVTRNARRRFDLCKGRQLARVLSRGQNGKRADFGVVVRSPCRRH
jgi:hypothetical protein